MNPVNLISENFVGRTSGTQRHIEVGGNYYIVSYIPYAFDTGMSETLVFHADVCGEVTDWGDIAGGRRMSLDEATDDLLLRLSSGSLKNTDESVGDMMNGWEASGFGLASAVDFILNSCVED